ncbi:MAG: sugar phosphate nucleotidyltransferase [Patescibacteria group bacterium]
MIRVIFAGGLGARLWPLSRLATPKQFEPFFEGKSTLQLAVDRVRHLSMGDLFISTNERYVDLVRDQVPDLSLEHIFYEPVKRDLAAAVCLTLLRLKARGAFGAVAVLWADHVMQRTDVFVKALARAEDLVRQNPERFAFLAETPRFANHNLGWMQLGEALEPGVYAFRAWKYRPDAETCGAMFHSGQWRWNPGYFVFDIDFALSLYREYQPAMLKAIKEMMDDEAQLKVHYGDIEQAHFDQAIIEHLAPEQAVVLPVDMGWSDPGTLYAMKELLASSEDDNVEHGNVVMHNTRDAFVYSTNAKQLVTTVGLDGVVVVNTPDSVLVCDKRSVPEIKELLKKLEEQGFAAHL